MNETIEFAILKDKYEPTLKEVNSMAKELWDIKHTEDFKIIEASFNANDERFLELKVSFGDWIYEGILDLNQKGQDEILEAMKKHFSFANQEKSE